MIYLAVNQNQVKTLYFKKSIFGQYDINFYEKQFQLDLISPGKINNVDVLASAIKEALIALFPKQIKEKAVTLIVPQSFFRFVRTEIPSDLALNAVNSFVQEKLKGAYDDLNGDYTFGYQLIDNNNQKQVNAYAISQENLNILEDTLGLLELNLVRVIPDTLAYFKLIEKTLRKDKRENIFFAHTDSQNIYGYLFDTLGYSGDERWQVALTEKSNQEAIFKEKAMELEKSGKKLNRLILSGPSSEKIRQDTFTKNTGVWTNPLKRIIGNFYQDYLKILIPQNKPLSILNYDICFGGFIFANENQKFWNKAKNNDYSKKALPKISIKKEYVIAFVSFVLSFLLAILLSNLNINFKLPQIPKLSPIVKQTPTPQIIKPTSTPTPTINKSLVKVKILNGSGIAGKASELKTIFSDAGYQDIVTDNADNFDYKISEIQIKKNQSQLSATILADLKKYITSPTQTILANTETADVVVIIGEDFK